jgi:c-di-GMP-binding flagellar brake protein YcgR
MTAETGEDQRQFERTSFRASATIYVPDADAEGNYRTIRAWTDDVSASGANILTEGPLGDTRFCIRILMPGLEEQLIECECVRHGKTQTKTLSNLQEITRYSSGVEFVGVCNDPKLLAIASGE